jgi:hypothetical protein
VKFFVIVLIVLLTATSPQPPARGRDIVTASASFTLHLNAAADRSFVLFDPVNETKWDPDWRPKLLGDRVQEGLVFLVGDGEGRTTWLVDRYEPQAHRISYVVAARSTLTRISIAVSATNASASVANVTYVKTALDERAVPELEQFAAHFAAHAAPHWEAAINTALERSAF